MSNLDKLNTIYEAHKDHVNGSFHNCLWQVMINDSLQGSDAAFVLGMDQVIIALGDGGYIPAMFGITIHPDAVLADLNEQVFGLVGDAPDQVMYRSMRNKVAK